MRILNSNTSIAFGMLVCLFSSVQISFAQKEISDSTQPKLSEKATEKSLTKLPEFGTAKLADKSSDNSPAAAAAAAAKIALRANEKRPDSGSINLKKDRLNSLEKLARANFSELSGWRTITHVSLQSDLNSKSARPGDQVWGLLDDDCKWGNKLVACSDSLIKGHLVEISGARTMARSILSSDRRFHNSGTVTIQFDEIVDQDGNSWPIVGRLCRVQLRRDITGSAPRVVQIDKKGVVTRANETLTDKERAVFTGLKLATWIPIPASYAINMVASPVAMGIAGAIYPSFVYDKPVDHSKKGVRRRAFAYGFLTNLPGAFAVQACVEKGEEINLKAGDQLIVDMTFKENVYCSGGQLSVNGAVLKDDDATNTASNFDKKEDPKIPASNTDKKAK